ncbi:MAG: DAK2 domain-containing protein [Clostridia bacterium]|nr:DAK2 domain-containing protein [Clostridia bacterium]
MITTINGSRFRSLIDYGIRNLTLYRDKVNDLNVFPVPDGDTGTNMVKTLQNGFAAIAQEGDRLSELSKKFSKAVVFGARGNSGVIVSQFFKGFSECFYDTEEADSSHFVSALERGVQCAYRAVSNPVEGTILTVLRESSEAMREHLQQDPSVSITEAVSLLLERAKLSLDNTPNLLPILRSAGVVDSGGAGIVYVFEGMEKLLTNRPVEPPVTEEAPEKQVDYTAFSRSSDFRYGYCTELLLQQTDGAKELEPSAFRRELEGLGDSVAVVFEEDKVKVHVHTRSPEQVLAFAHAYGEFLSLKIENMSVQHTNAVGVEAVGGATDGPFGVVAVSHDGVMKERFLAMGADVVLAGNGELQPSAEDFIRAYRMTGASEILVFPNSKNSNLTALQAGGLCHGVNVTVFDTKTVAECYAALSMMDFEAADLAALKEEIDAVIGNVYPVAILRAGKDSVFDGTSIRKGDPVALSGNALLGTGADPVTLALQVAETVLTQREPDTLTVFAGRSVSAHELEPLTERVASLSPYTDLDLIQTESTAFELLLSFE